MSSETTHTDFLTPDVARRMNGGMNRRRLLAIMMGIALTEAGCAPITAPFELASHLTKQGQKCLDDSDACLRDVQAYIERLAWSDRPQMSVRRAMPGTNVQFAPVATPLPGSPSAHLPLHRDAFPPEVLAELERLANNQTGVIADFPNRKPEFSQGFIVEVQWGRGVQHVMVLTKHGLIDQKTGALAQGLFIARSVRDNLPAFQRKLEAGLRVQKSEADGYVRPEAIVLHPTLDLAFVPLGVVCNVEPFRRELAMHKPFLQLNDEPLQPGTPTIAVAVDVNNRSALNAGWQFFDPRGGEIPSDEPALLRSWGLADLRGTRIMRREAFPGNSGSSVLVRNARGDYVVGAMTLQGSKIGDVISDVSLILDAYQIRQELTVLRPEIERRFDFVRGGYRDACASVFPRR